MIQLFTVSRISAILLWKQGVLSPVQERSEGSAYNSTKGKLSPPGPWIVEGMKIMLPLLSSEWELFTVQSM